MSKKYRPIYECDNCHKEFDDSFQVRSFEGSVSDGEGDIVFIENYLEELENPGAELMSSMYCIDCIPIVLKLNKSTSKEFQKQELFDKIKHNESILPNIMENKILEATENLINDDYFYEKLKQNEKEIENLEEAPGFEEPKLVDLSNTEVQHNLKVDANPYKKEEITESENKFEQFEAIELEEDGKFLVLYRISNKEQEEYLANQYGHPDVKSLRDAYGGSLIGVYISSNGYFNEIPINSSLSNIQVINKVIFGIPNVVSKDAFIKNEMAYIEKENFNLQIESVKIEKKQDIKNEDFIEESIAEEDVLELKEIIPETEFDDEFGDGDNDYI